MSNHGGRQLDTRAGHHRRAARDRRRAVGGRVPVLLDGGIRRGTDVVKALALGATRSASAGRSCGDWPPTARTACRGVLELLRDEFDHALALCGAASLADLTPDLVRTY